MSVIKVLTPAQAEARRIEGMVGKALQMIVQSHTNIFNAVWFPRRAANGELPFTTQQLFDAFGADGGEILDIIEKLQFAALSLHPSAIADDKRTPPTEAIDSPDGTVTVPAPWPPKPEPQPAPSESDAAEKPV